MAKRRAKSTNRSQNKPSKSRPSARGSSSRSRSSSSRSSAGESSHARSGGSTRSRSAGTSGRSSSSGRPKPGSSSTRARSAGSSTTRKPRTESESSGQGSRKRAGTKSRQQVDSPTATAHRKKKRSGQGSTVSSAGRPKRSAGSKTARATSSRSTTPAGARLNRQGKASPKKPAKSASRKRSDESARSAAVVIGPQRLQKVLAAAGYGSRRECESLIAEGRIEVDRQIVTELGTKVDPEEQAIRVDGEAIPSVKRYYFAVNKPTGIVSTNRDPDGRMRVIDLVGGPHRLFTVGRLDKSSEGLIVVTNDGELANRLTHPRYGIEKVYRVQVVGAPSADVLKKLTQGIHLADGFAQAKNVKFKKRLGAISELELVLDEGRNREVRRLLARIGHKVLRLKRIAIGPLGLGNLPTGDVRRLSSQEIDALYRAVGN